MDDRPILISHEELMRIIRDEIMAAVPLFHPQPEFETLSLAMALQILKEHGLPTSPAKMYKLTSSGAIPHSKYGNKLVFSRKELKKWMKEQIVKVDNARNRF